MFGLSVQELIIVGIVAVLLYGKRLPEVAKSLGRQYQQFRKGLADIQSSLNVNLYDSYSYPSSNSSSSYPSSSSSTSSSYEDSSDHDEPTAPKFELPPGEPQDAASSAAPASAEVTYPPPASTSSGSEQPSNHGEPTAPKSELPPSQPQNSASSGPPAGAEAPVHSQWQASAQEPAGGAGVGPISRG